MSERKIVTLDDIERRHAQEHFKPYFAWIRTVVGLATGTLTGLVALQGHYVPKAPVLPAVLAASWVALFLAIASGLLALRAEFLVHLKALKNLKTVRATRGDEFAVLYVQSGAGAVEPGRVHQYLVRVMVVLLLLALAALCAFAIANLNGLGT